MEKEKNIPTTPQGTGSTATDGSIAINGGENTITINESKVISRFLDIIAEQNKTIARLQEQILRLSGLTKEQAE